MKRERVEQREVESRAGVREVGERDVSSIFPPLSSIVNIDYLDYVASLLDISEISKLIGARIVKLRPRYYIVKSRGSLTPHLIYLAFSFCKTYVYYSLALGGQIVSESSLRVMARGVLAHRAYARELKSRLNKSVVLEEVDVEGEIAGVDVKGRVDLLVLVTDSLRLSRGGVVSSGELYVAEVKTSREISRGQIAQVVAYRKLLDADAIALAICKSTVKPVTEIEVNEVWREVKRTVRELLNLYDPPPPDRAEKCKFCPLARLKICVYAKT